MLRHFLFAGLYVTGLAAACGADVALIPEPVSLQVREGQFRLTADTQVGAAGPAVAEARKLIAALAPALGCELKLTEAEPADAALISLALDDALRSELGPEGYTLERRTPADRHPRCSTGRPVLRHPDPAAAAPARDLRPTASRRRRVVRPVRSTSPTGRGSAGAGC